jgi:hypothetical protein
VVSAFIATAPPIPLVALVTSTILYLGQTDAGRTGSSIIAGLIVASISWFVGAGVFWLAGLGRADRANSRAYFEVRERFQLLEAQFVAIAPPTPTRPETTRTQWEAYTQASALRETLVELFSPCKDEGKYNQKGEHKERMRSGLGWVRATMYVNLWTLVHRFEEALILLQPVEAVCAGARYDELRLLNSDVANQSDLLNILRCGVRALCDAAAVYLTLAVAQAASAAATSRSTTASDGEAAPSQPSSERCTCDDVARAMLREVRRAIDEFRDDRRDGLVRVRNTLVNTLFITGLATFVLLMLAIISGASVTEVKAGAVFYVVGALAGLVNRLFLDFNSDSAVEDYGLSVVRLVVIPIISGLTALGGVLVTAQLPLSPPTSNTISVSSPSTPALNTIYNLDSNGFGIVTAAIFGLTPNLLIGRLTQSEQYKAQLQSTTAPTAKSS